jgi:AcrR family transcriptional regulator
VGDRRVRKTQESIQAALVALLGGKPYDKITVTELCARADVSRITFYAHYADKDALIEEMFQRLAAVALADFGRLQGENNPGGDAVQSYRNLLSCILDLFESDGPFLRQMSQRRNPALHAGFYSRVFEQVLGHVERERSRLTPLLGSAPLSAFLCSGLWAYIDACYAQRVPLARIREETQALLTGILQSEVFIRTA